MNIIQESDNNRISPVERIDGVAISFAGDNNVITFSKGTKFSGCRFTISGNNSRITIGASKYGIYNLQVYATHSQLVIGNDFSCWGCDMRLHEPNSEISIGNDCMFSSEIALYATDVHAIYDDETKTVLNFSKPIRIGNHVWVGRRVGILKGSEINDNSIVGFGSVVNRKFTESNICIAGAPAQIVKSGINWDRRNPYNYDLFVKSRDKAQ